MKKLLLLLPFLTLPGCNTVLVDDSTKYAWQQANCGADLGKLRVGMSEQRMKDCSFATGYTPYVDHEFVNPYGRNKVYTDGMIRVYVANGSVLGWSKR